MARPAAPRRLLCSHTECRVRWAAATVWAAAATPVVPVSGCRPISMARTGRASAAPMAATVSPTSPMTCARRPQLCAAAYSPATVTGAGAPAASLVGVDGDTGSTASDQRRTVRACAWNSSRTSHSARQPPCRPRAGVGSSTAALAINTAAAAARSSSTSAGHGGAGDSISSTAVSAASQSSSSTSGMSRRLPVLNPTGRNVVARNTSRNATRAPRTSSTRPAPG